MRISIKSLLAYFVLLSLVMYWMMHVPVPVLSPGPGKAMHRPSTTTEAIQRAGFAVGGTWSIIAILWLMQRGQAWRRARARSGRKPVFIVSTFAGLVAGALIFLGLLNTFLVVVLVIISCADHSVSVSPEGVIIAAVLTVAMFAIANVIQAAWTN